MSQIIIGYTTEGTTDARLLESIIMRTFVAVGFECNKQIEVISPVIPIEKNLGDKFKEQIFQSSKDAFEKGIMAFCVHVDADSESDSQVITDKIAPTFKYILESAELSICKNLVAVIPVRMSEAWMLADKQLLKDEIGTEMLDIELGINFHPESFSNPKATIINAIHVARQGITRRRRRDLSISELYQPIGQKISLAKLTQLSSYNKFEEAVRLAYRKLNYL